MSVPEGFDSFFLGGTAVTFLLFVSNAFRHAEEPGPHPNSPAFEYLIKDEMQIRPKYLVEFSFDAKKESLSRQGVLCNNCPQPKVASVFSTFVKMPLCRECCDTLHSQLAAQRMGAQAAPLTNLLAQCHLHQRPLEFFCQKCQKLCMQLLFLLYLLFYVSNAASPVCPTCLLGDAHKGHTLVETLSKCNEARDRASQRDVSMDRLFGSMETHQLEIQARKDALGRNREYVRRTATEIYNKVMEDIDKCFDRKVHRNRVICIENVETDPFLVLLFQNCELDGELSASRRFASRLCNFEEFLKYQLEAPDQVRLLVMWPTHSRLVGDLATVPTDRGELRVKADLAVVGQVHVIEESKVPGGGSGSRSVASTPARPRAVASAAPTPAASAAAARPVAMPPPDLRAALASSSSPSKVSSSSPSKASPSKVSSSPKAKSPGKLRGLGFLSKNRGAAATGSDALINEALQRS